MRVISFTGRVGLWTCSLPLRLQRLFFFPWELPLCQATLLAFTRRAWYHGYYCMHCFSCSHDTLRSSSTAKEWSLGTTQLFPSLLGRISSVGRALDCRAGSRGFESRGGINAQGKKKLRNEGTPFTVQAARP